MPKRFHESIKTPGMDYVHSQERQDGAMIHEDYSAMSNLPQNVVIRPYPQNDFNLSNDIYEDTITGVDNQINNLDGKKIKSGYYPKKN